MQLVCTASFIGRLWLLNRFLLGFSQFSLVLSRSWTMWKTLPSTRDCSSNCVMTWNPNIVPCSFIHPSGGCLQVDFCPASSLLARKLKCFLMYRKKCDLLEILKSEHFELHLAYLVDIFEIFNSWTWDSKERIQTCSATGTQYMHFWPNWSCIWRASVGKFMMFPSLNEVLADGQLSSTLSKEIMDHLSQLDDERRVHWAYPRFNSQECVPVKLLV